MTTCLKDIFPFNDVRIMLKFYIIINWQIFKKIIETLKSTIFKLKVGYFLAECKVFRSGTKPVGCVNDSLNAK